MALVQTWYLQGVTPTELEDGDFLAFTDGTFGNPITVDGYNDGTHVRGSGGADDSTANTPNNVKYVASGTGDWGDGTEDMADILEAECTLHIDITYDTNITVTDITMYAYDGTTPATGPVAIKVYMAELADAAWTEVDGSGTALSITDSDTPATTHDFYVSVSLAPESVGVKSTDKMRIAFTYQ